MAETNPTRGAYARRDYAQKVAHVQALCRRIEAGETVADICRDPTMPLRSTMMSWLTRHDELRSMFEAAVSAAAEVFGPRRAYHRWEPEIAAEVLARIEDGRGLSEVCVERDLPAYTTVMRWINERPDYLEAYLRARETQADRLFDLAWRIALEATEDTARTARLKIQTLKWRCQKLAPRRYGTIKAQPPEDEAPAEDALAPTPTRFEVRHFAGTPDGKVVETTRAVRGMSPDENRALREAIRAGRITVAALDELNAAGAPAAMVEAADVLEWRSRRTGGGA